MDAYFKLLVFSFFGKNLLPRQLRPMQDAANEYPVIGFCVIDDMGTGREFEIVRVAGQVCGHSDIFEISQDFYAAIGFNMVFIGLFQAVLADAVDADIFQIHIGQGGQLIA